MISGANARLSPPEKSLDGRWGGGYVGDMFRTMTAALGVAALAILTVLGISSGGDVKGKLMTGDAPALQAATTVATPTCVCPYSPQPGGLDTCEGTHQWCNLVAKTEADCKLLEMHEGCNPPATCGTDKIVSHASCKWIQSQADHSWFCAVAAYAPNVSCHLVQHPKIEVTNDFCGQAE